MSEAKRDQIYYSTIAGGPGWLLITGAQFTGNVCKIVRKVRLPHDSKLVSVLCGVFEPAGLRN